MFSYDIYSVQWNCKNEKKHFFTIFLSLDAGAWLYRLFQARWQAIIKPQQTAGAPTARQETRDSIELAVRINISFCQCELILTSSLTHLSSFLSSFNDPVLSINRNFGLPFTFFQF